MKYDIDYVGEFIAKMFGIVAIICLSILTIFGTIRLIIMMF